MKLVPLWFKIRRGQFFQVRLVIFLKTAYHKLFYEIGNVSQILGVVTIFGAKTDMVHIHHQFSDGDVIQ